MVGFGLWALGFVFAIVRAGSRATGQGRGLVRSTALVALVISLPQLLVTSILFSDSVNLQPVLGVAFAGLTALWIVVTAALWVRVRRRRFPTAAVGVSGGKPRILLSGLLTISIFAVPLALDYGVERRLHQSVQACRDMSPKAAQAPESLLRIFAEACKQRASDEVERKIVGDIRVDFYAGEHTSAPEAANQAGSMVGLFAKLLGPPATERITIHAVRIPGPVRGMAGPGYIFIDEEELVRPSCSFFRLTQGRAGICGGWVLAHELAHQWFPGVAELGPVEDRVAWEATADYLAWNWWRSANGTADADKLYSQLFVGRMRLEPDFVSSYAPAGLPQSLSDYQERALIYGRGSAGLVAADREIGQGVVIAVLRDAYLNRSDAALTVETILDSAETISPEVADLLERWWLDSTFDPLD